MFTFQSPTYGKAFFGCPGSRLGVTIIELLVVTTILGLLAALVFPAFKLMQQRDKEVRLHGILVDLDYARNAYTAYVTRQLIGKVEAAHPTSIPGWENLRSKAIEKAIKSGEDGGLLFPQNPSKFVDSSGVSFDLATGPTVVTPTAGVVTVVINQRFIRRIPPHPFVGWYPTAHFEFEGASPSKAFPLMPLVWQDKQVASAEWVSGGETATGVSNVWSVGAGIAIDGSITDKWNQ